MSEQKFETVPWTTRQTFIGVCFTLVPWLTLNFLLAFAFPSSSSPSSKVLSPQVDATNAVVTFIFSALVEGAFLLAPFYFARRTTPASEPPGRAVPQALGFRRFPLLNVAPLLVLLILAIFAVNIASQYVITNLHLHVQMNDQVVLLRGKTEPLTIYATLFVAVFIAPFCEELFFRSFTFMGLLRDFNPIWSIVLSALIFAVAHGDPASFIVLFFIGIALAFLRWRTRSVWPGMLLHMLNNGISAALILLALHH